MRPEGESTNPVRPVQLAVVGVGLLGGSVGLAARRRGVASRVVGVGRDARTLARAQSLGAIDAMTTDLAEGVAGADIVVVCTPVDRVAADVVAAAGAAPAHALITDVGSTKGAIVAEVEAQLGPGAAHFVGSHPLAGSEKRGASYADADLFDGRTVVVTPSDRTDPEAVSGVERFWQRLGARVVRMDPESHDQALSYTSHLPHAVAAGLAGVTPPGWLHLSAGGFRDATRIAAGDPELWASIFEANRPAMLSALGDFHERMRAFGELLATGDRGGLVAWLTEAKRVRDAL